MRIVTVNIMCASRGSSLPSDYILLNRSNTSRAENMYVIKATFIMRRVVISYLVRQRSPPAEAAETKVLGRVFWRRIFTIENGVRNYWKLSSTFALIDVSLTSRPS